MRTVGVLAVVSTNRQNKLSLKAIPIWDSLFIFMPTGNEDQFVPRRTESILVLSNLDNRSFCQHRQNDEQPSTISSMSIKKVRPHFRGTFQGHFRDNSRRWLTPHHPLPSVPSFPSSVPNLNRFQEQPELSGRNRADLAVRGHQVVPEDAVRPWSYSAECCCTSARGNACNQKTCPPDTASAPVAARMVAHSSPTGI